MQLNGKTPQACIDQLYAAIYICSRDFIINGFPLDQACKVLGNKHDLVIKQLNDDLKGYVYVEE